MLIPEVPRQIHCTDFWRPLPAVLCRQQWPRPDFNFAKTENPASRSSKILLITDFMRLFIILINCLVTWLCFKGPIEVLLAKLITNSYSIILLFLCRCDVLFKRSWTLYVPLASFSSQILGDGEGLAPSTPRGLHFSWMASFFESSFPMFWRFTFIHWWNVFQCNLHLHSSSYPKGCHDNFDLLTGVAKCNVSQCSARPLVPFFTVEKFCRIFLWVNFCLIN